MEDTERVFCREQWRAEAAAVIADVSAGLRVAAVSEALAVTDDAIHINVELLEGTRYCVELSAKGFAVVGHEFDKKDVEPTVYFETPYSLLDSLSPEYRKSFYERLSAKLEEVQKNNT